MTDDPDELERLAARLHDDRPLPSPGFRARVRSTVLHAPASRPARLWTRVASLAGGGVACLAVASTALFGGPLA